MATIPTEFRYNSNASFQYLEDVKANKFVGTITGNSATKTFTITHNIGTKDLVVSVRGTSSPNTDNQVECDISPNSTNSVDIIFATAPATGVNFSVTVVG